MRGQCVSGHVVKALTEKAREDAEWSLAKNKSNRHQVKARVRFIMGLE